MQGIARTTKPIANTSPATAAGTPGSSQTVRRPAMPVVSLSKQVYLKSVLLNEVEKLL